VEGLVVVATEGYKLPLPAVAAAAIALLIALVCIVLNGKAKNSHERRNKKTKENHEIIKYHIKSNSRDK